MIRRAALCVTLALSLTGTAGANPRIVSLNMCTDQLVLALADREQIAGISHLAHRPAMSWHWQQAQGLRTLAGQAEEVLPLRPDLVVTASFARTQTRALLHRQGLTVEGFGSARSVADVRDQIRRAGALFGHTDRADAAIARIDGALARLIEQPLDRPVRALPLERRGWVSGGDTLMADLLRLAGFDNLGIAAGLAGGRLTLEQIVRLQPEVLVLSSDPERADDQGTALLSHPALARLVPPHRRIVLPQAMTICAGPMLADALDRLADERRSLRAR
mgnify:CR=1 FL=1